MTQSNQSAIGYSLVIAIAFFLTVAAPNEGQAKSVAPELKKETTFLDGETFVLADARLVSAAEMGELRGGFIDPTGLLFKFAVDVHASIDGALTFIRSLVLTPSGIGGDLQATTSAQLTTEGLSEGTAQVVGNGAGVVLSDKSGKTTILNQPASHRLASIITNTADNRIISQTVTIDIVLQNVQTSLANLSAIKNFHSPAGLFQAGRMHSIGFGL